MTQLARTISGKKKRGIFPAFFGDEKYHQSHLFFGKLSKQLWIYGGALETSPFLWDYPPE